MSLEKLTQDCSQDHSIRAVLEYFALRERSPRGGETKVRDLKKHLRNFSENEALKVLRYFEASGYGTVKIEPNKDLTKIIWRDNLSVVKLAKDVLRNSEKKILNPNTVSNTHQKEKQALLPDSSLSIPDPYKFNLFLKFIESQLPEDKFQKVVDYAELLA